LSRLSRFLKCYPKIWLAKPQRSRHIPQLSLQLSSRAINQTLAVGGGAAVVEVNVTPPGVELAKTTPTIDRTLSQRVVEEMPITGNTRDVTRLALLAPTVNRAPGSNEFSAKDD
jgi:hypothetical protein